MTELKSAVKLLFSILKANSKVPDDTKIAVIPFNTVVNIGTGFVDSPWMSYDSTVTKTNWNGCVADRDQPNDVKDTTPNGAPPTMFPAAMCGTLAKALPLTSDWDTPQRHGRHHDADRQHQRDHRHGVGLACADPERTVHSGASRSSPTSKRS